MEILGVHCPVWLILTTLFIILVYLYGTWPYTYFSSRGIPGPKPLPFIGNFIDFFTKTEIENERNWVKKYGKTFGYYLGRSPVLSVQDPDVIKRIMISDFQKFTNRQNDDAINPPMDKALVFLEDKEWKAVRHAILPAFTTGKLRQASKAITECGFRLRNLTEIAAKTGEIKNLKNVLGSYALEVISSTAFGLKVDAQTDKNDPFLKAVRKIFEVAIPINYLISKVFPFLRCVTDYLGLGIWSKSAISFFSNTVKKMIDERKNGNMDEKDFFQLLIHAKTPLENGKEEFRDLSRDEIVAQCFLFFIAGYETTASLMTFTCYNLARHPHYQQKVYEEMQEVLGDEEPTFDNVNKLVFLGQCLYETLRMFPPTNSITRVAQEDVELGGYQVPKGTVINIPFNYIHNDPTIYPEPEKYDPDRFLPEKRTATQPTFLAFGTGPRMCLGNRLAILEAKIALCNVLKSFRLELRDDQEELEFLPGPILFATKPITLKIIPRHA